MCKRFICAVVSIIMMCQCMLMSSAQNYSEKEVLPGIELHYEFTEDAMSYIGISNNMAMCECSIYSKSNVTQIRITMYLQKKSLLWWNEVESWSAGFRDDSASLSKTFSVDSGTYRVKTVFEVYSGSEFETITSYSTSVKV